MFSVFSCLQWKMSEVLSPVEWESKYWYKKDQTKKYQRVDPQLRDWASLGLWRCRPPTVSYITTWNMTNMISKLYFKILSLKIPQVLSHITGKFGRTMFPWILRDRNMRRGHLSWNSWQHSYKDWRHSQLKNGKQTVYWP